MDATCIVCGKRKIEELWLADTCTYCQMEILLQHAAGVCDLLDRMESSCGFGMLITNLSESCNYIYEAVATIDEYMAERETADDKH